MSSRRVALAGVGLLASTLLAGCAAGGEPSGDRVGSAGVTDGTAPAQPAESVEDLPSGDPPAAPSWRRGVLHVGGTAIRTPLRQLAFAGGTTLAGSIMPGPGGAGWWLVDGDELVPVVERPDVGTPRISPDGELVVWSEVGPEVTTVRAWHVPTRHLVASHEVAIAPMCCTGPSLEVFGVDGSHRVYLRALRTADSPLEVWDPAAGTVRRVSGLGRLGPAPSVVSARGPVFQGQGTDVWDLPGIHGTVDEAGRFHREGRVPTDQLGVWSPDGRLLAYPGDAAGEVVPKAPGTALHVLDVDTGERRTLRLPDSRGTSTLLWESDDAVLVQVSTGPDEHVLVRCEVTTRACETALRLGRPDQWWFPM